MTEISIVIGMPCGWGAVQGKLSFEDGRLVNYDEAHQQHGQYFPSSLDIPWRCRHLRICTDGDSIWFEQYLGRHDLPPLTRERRTNAKRIADICSGEQPDSRIFLLPHRLNAKS